MEEKEDEDDYLKRYSEERKYEDTTIQSNFLTKPAEERKDEDNKTKRTFLLCL